jgi:signal peptidase I
MPLWLEYSASFFPVIVAVFILRSFLIEPFKIPSGSMIPTLQIGDFIVVNKYTYGIRLPVINKKVIDIGTPKRGDVVVFRYPKDESVDYIKRVIAIPGDEILYQDKKVTINGKPLSYTGGSSYLDPESMRYASLYNESYPADLGGNQHQILNDPDRSTIYQSERFPGAEFCQYQGTAMSCKVPPGHYFVMGDNRDNSLDSRFWGFVPDQNLVGRAFFIWLNMGSLGRIGSFN